jgi:small nuclear ribonucleoprotein G
MDKRLFLQLNGKRKVTGVLRGFDPFLNLVLDNAMEETDPNDVQDIGMIVIRGNSIVMMEALERV